MHNNYVRSINKNKIHILRNNLWQKSNQELPYIYKSNFEHDKSERGLSMKYIGFAKTCNFLLQCRPALEV